MTRCPRCGEPMNGGICDNCGFPMMRVRKNVFNVSAAAAAADRASEKKQVRQREE